jgi:hypothetical protein
MLDQLRAAVRSVRHRRGVAAAVVATLTLGIGENSVIFSFVDAVLLRPLPYPEAERLVAACELNQGLKQATQLVAPVRLEEWNRDNRTFAGLAGSYFENVDLPAASQHDAAVGVRGDRAARRGAGRLRRAVLTGRRPAAGDRRPAHARRGRQSDSRADPCPSRCDDGGRHDRRHCRRSARARVMATFLFGISTHDPVTFVVVPVVLSSVAAAATLVRARRAASIDPMRALREE